MNTKKSVSALKGQLIPWNIFFDTIEGEQILKSYRKPVDHELPMLVYSCFNGCKGIEQAKELKGTVINFMDGYFGNYTTSVGNILKKYFGIPKKIFLAYLKDCEAYKTVPVAYRCEEQRRFSINLKLFSMGRPANGILGTLPRRFNKATGQYYD